MIYKAVKVSWITRQIEIVNKKKFVIIKMNTNNNIINLLFC